MIAVIDNLANGTESSVTNSVEESVEESVEDSTEEGIAGSIVGIAVTRIPGNSCTSTSCTSYHIAVSNNFSVTKLFIVTCELSCKPPI